MTIASHAGPLHAGGAHFVKVDGFVDNKMNVVCVEKGGCVRGGGGKLGVYRGNGCCSIVLMML